MPIRLAIIVSHPIQYFAPWHRELAKIPDLELKVFFCCDWGLNTYLDPQFKTEVKWDIPLVEGYGHEFLPIARRPERLGFWEVDNPAVTSALDRFQPDVVKIFGYAHRTNWRAASWARRYGRPLLLYSDSNGQIVPPVWKRAIKDLVVGSFYSVYVDGAFCIGNNNRRYHARYGISTERLFGGILPVATGRLLQSVRDRVAIRTELRRKFNIPEGAFVVMFCGKYQPHKRPLDAVMAVHNLAGKDLPVWCLLVGDGPERASITAFCERERATNVLMTGFVNQAGIGPFYAASDLLAMPSSLDAYGLAVSEASAFGLPVVISDRVGCIGPNDSAQPDANAIVYPCADVPALTNAIELLWRDRDLYQRMSAKSSEIAASQDVTVAAERLASAVRQLHQMGRRADSQDRLRATSEVTAS
ncbi:MAG TPA: glycosyltransferase family 4 protein [Terriglobia bacterium]|nr:glycosyltransferase family 4 protein [Terriglobia bacterium]